MPAYTSPVDIGNRALDHAGVRAIVSLTDGSRNAAKVAETYEKLREEELRANLWVFATRKAAVRPLGPTTMQLVPNAYASTTEYNPGDIVSYLGDIWSCLQQTTGNAPIDGNGVTSAFWDNYFGPMTVDVWNNPVSTSANVATGASYHAGEIVYIAPGNGTFSAFISLVDGNDDDPLAPTAWDATTTYAAGQLVLGSDNNLYQSAFSLNVGNDPTITVPVAAWVSGTTYAAGAYVYASDGQIYQSLVGGNVGNAPPTSPADWSPAGMWNGAWQTSLTPQPRSTSNKWHFLACSLQPINIVYPVGSGPVDHMATPNVYMLPNGWLMRAPNDAQLGSKFSWLGAHAAMPEDYVFQGNYLVSWSATPIVLRFIGNFRNVTRMDALFCAGVAARMGSELCETLTQKPELKVACERAYVTAINRAQMVNAIEIGPITEVEDEYIRVRI